MTNHHKDHPEYSELGIFAGYMEYENKAMIGTIRITEYGPVAICGTGFGFNCMDDPYKCPCGYAEGLSKPHYPVPAKDMITTGADWFVVIEAMVTYPLELNDYY